MLGGLLFLAQVPRAGEFSVGLRSLTPGEGGTPQSRYTSCLLIATPWVWDLPIPCLCPSYLSMWLLYTLSYRKSIQLVFRWFSVMVILYFSCNFDVITWGSEFKVYQLYHLDSAPKLKILICMFIATDRYLCEIHFCVLKYSKYFRWKIF